MIMHYLDKIVLLNVKCMFCFVFLVLFGFFVCQFSKLGQRQLSVIK